MVVAGSVYFFDLKKRKKRVGEADFNFEAWEYAKPFVTFESGITPFLQSQNLNSFWQGLHHSSQTTNGCGDNEIQA